MSSLDSTCVRVLIADDSGAVRQRLCELLQENHCLRVVGQAASTAEAWALFKQQRPAAVVLDLQFPDGSGFDLLHQIKRTEPGCLVLILTSHGEPVFREECRRRGADHFLHKSTEFERVPELLSRAYRSRPAGPAHAKTQRLPSALSEQKTALFGFASAPAAQAGPPALSPNIQPATP
jgi:DNA-binding NarL/FixJ family response regulator